MRSLVDDEQGKLRRCRSIRSCELSIQDAGGLRVVIQGRVIRGCDKDTVQVARQPPEPSWVSRAYQPKCIDNTLAR